MRLQQLRAKAADLVAKMGAISKAAGDSPLTDEQRAQFDTLKAEHDTVVADIAREEGLQASLRTYTPGTPDPNTEAQQRSAAAAGVRVEVHERAEDDPRRGFRDHTDQLMSIMRSAQSGVVDPRLRLLATAGGDEQGSHTNPHGAFLLAPAFQPDLLSLEAEVDPVGSLVRRVPMQTDRVVFNARVDKDHSSSVSGGLTVTRTPQTVAATSSRMEFEGVDLVVHDLCGVGIASNRILQTSPLSFMMLLQSGFRDEFAATLLDERINGTGVAEFEGVLNAACTITVAKKTGQAADTILFENVNDMRARQWRYGRSIWLANHDTLPQVTTLVMPIGTGGQHVSIYSPGDEAAPQGRLLGRPIYFTEFCQKLGDKGDILNCVWSEYLEGTLGGMQQSSSVHVRFLNREEVFLFVVANDGKAWWRSALTPKYSTVTLSPFVTLAARA